ncbi:MAG: glycosyltransferase family 2 protein [Candidatus Peribacteraceae bacterium]|nr:glycosyltransferase family 2 protein [Candidatus Peribacteraceae bacterium]MDD5075162.1 glycosyltransferase family 2 protein [Candidatus Peribacteraceae bacterium]
MDQPRLSIVMPVYNEERTLETIVRRVLAACGDFAEVIFTDDGSRDGSLAILKRLARPQDTVLTKPNGGKGSAVRMGYARARGRYVIVQDADLEYSPEEIPGLLAFAERQNLPAVFGSRRLKKQKQFAHITSFVGGSMLTVICNLLYGTRLTDQPTCYKMVRSDVLKTLPLKESDFRYDPEITVMLVRRGIAIAEYPVSYAPRTFAEGKKIGWKDWILWVWVFVKLRVFSKRKLFGEA